MTQEQKATAYDEALLRADEAVQKGCLDKDMFDIIFPPEESEDEKIRKDLIYDIERLPMQGVLTHRPTSEYIAYLEKQKDLMPPTHVDPCDASWDAYYRRGLNKGYELKKQEQKPNIEICPHSIKSKSYSENPITPEMMDKAADECIWNQCGDNRFWIIDRAKKDILAKTNIESSPEEMKVLDSFLFRCWQMGWLSKYDVIVPEQKPTTDSRGYSFLSNIPSETMEQIKPVETSDFKTKLAEYLQNNSPKDGQYVISSESILEMAKEELIKRGELPNPVEWSEEDEDKLKQCIRIVTGWEADYDIVKSPYSNFLKSLRPQWKPTEEQMKALNWARCLIFETYTDKHIATEPYHILGELYDQLKQLKDGTDRKD